MLINRKDVLKMYYERADFDNLQELYDEWKNLMNYHITIVIKDGSTVDGMIEKVEGWEDIKGLGAEVILLTILEQYFL